MLDLKYLNSALQMFYMEENAFDTFVRPQHGNTECFFVSKKTPQGPFNVMCSSFSTGPAGLLHQRGNKEAQ